MRRALCGFTGFSFAALHAVAAGILWIAAKAFADFPILLR
jgi:hypothetical protein